MIAELKIRYDALEAKRQIVFTLLYGLSAEQTTFRDGPGRWSILMALEHVDGLDLNRLLKGLNAGKERLPLNVAVYVAALVMGPLLLPCPWPLNHSSRPPCPTSFLALPFAARRKRCSTSA